MARNQDVRFVSSSIKIPRCSIAHPVPFHSTLPFARHHLSFHLDRARAAIHGFVASLPNRWRPSFLCSSSLAVARAEAEANPWRHGKEDEERVLISEVLIRNKDGEALERADLEAAAAAALKSCRPNSALTVREVQEDVHRIIESGFFWSCMPVAVDTRDGIRLVFQVSYAEILSGGILRLQVSEAEVNNIIIQFLDRRTGEPTTGKTRPETILQQLTTKKGQVYSRLQGKRDVETILTMGIMEDVTIIPQPTGDPRKVDLVMNLVERPSGGFSAGGGISYGITNGPLAGLIGSPIIRDIYNSPLTASGNAYDDMLIAKFEGVYTDSGDPSSSTLVFNMEQGLPVFPEWLCFNRVSARARQGYKIGPARLLLRYDIKCLQSFDIKDLHSVSGGHVVGNFPPHEAFAIGGINSVRGYEEAFQCCSVSGGHVVGNFPPHEAFAIGGINSVRGYEEGAVGSGRSYMVGSGEISFRMVMESVKPMPAQLRPFCCIRSMENSRQQGTSDPKLNFGPVEGVLFADYGNDLGSGPTVPGDPAGARGKPGNGCGFGAGIRVDSPLGPLRLEYALNDKFASRFHFGVGYRN
ncbi:Outer envelope protein 80, chloroplastic [Cocos nucifera]|uniref:Outer envelope protein 80, chloroplastic n=1 Tax=Cocos nucifera TaxID=13894 RepID=A0A8K0HU43_COCNU|nr:Outer envelope protein 80, chloroplastic [Cocos nucifera]